MGRPGPLSDAKRPTVTLRAAQAGDSASVLAWRNDPDAVRFSGSGTAVAAADHARWFAARLADPRTRLWIAEQGGTPVGMVRLDIEGRAATVSIAVDAERRGQGVGRALLAALTSMVAAEGEVDRLVALAHPGNVASVGAFERSGFRRMPSAADGFMILEWP